MKHLASGSFIRHGNVVMILSMTTYTIIQVVLLLHYQPLNRVHLDRAYANASRALLCSLVEYFGLNAEDHLDNDSYIRSAPIRVCKVINITLSSRVNSAPAHVGLVLLIFHSNEWHQVWNHTHDDHQWKFHHLQLDMNRSIDHIQVKRI